MSSSECLKLAMLSTMDFSMCPWNGLVYNVITSLSRHVVTFIGLQLNLAYRTILASRWTSNVISCYRLSLKMFKTVVFDLICLLTTISILKRVCECQGISPPAFLRIGKYSSLLLFLNFRLTFCVDCTFLFLKVQCSLIDSKLTMRRPLNLPLKT